MALSTRFAISFAGALVFVLPASGQNDILLPPQTFVAGATNVMIPVVLNSQADVYGFSLALRVNNSRIRIKGVALAATASNGADYSDGYVQLSGKRLAWGVLLDTAAPLIKKIPPGQGATIAYLLADVGTEAGMARVRFTDVPRDALSSGAVTRLVGAGGVALPHNGFEGVITIVDPSPQAVGPFRRGDCNQDGDTLGSPADAVFLLGFLFLGMDKPVCRAACDFNGDGELATDTLDVVYYLNLNFLGGPAMPPPVSGCGMSTRQGDLDLGCETSQGCP